MYDKQLQKPLIGRKTIEVPYETVIEVPFDVEHVIEVPTEKIVEKYLDTHRHRGVEQWVEHEAQLPISRVNEVYTLKEATVEKPYEVEKIIENAIEKTIPKVIEVRRIIEMPTYQEKVVEIEEIVIVEKKIEQVVNTYVEEIQEIYVDVPCEIDTIIQKPKYLDKVSDVPYNTHLLKRFLSVGQKETYTRTSEEIGRLRIENMQLKQNLGVVGGLSGTSTFTVVQQLMGEAEQLRNHIAQMEAKVSQAEHTRDALREKVNQPILHEIEVEHNDNNSRLLESHMKALENENSRLHQVFANDELAQWSHAVGTALLEGILGIGGGQHRHSHANTTVNTMNAPHGNMSGVVRQNQSVIVNPNVQQQGQHRMQSVAPAMGQMMAGSHAGRAYQSPDNNSGRGAGNLTYSTNDTRAYQDPQRMMVKSQYMPTGHAQQARGDNKMQAQSMVTNVLGGILKQR